MEKPVIILGANRIGKAALDIFESNDVTVYCFLDDREEVQDEVIGEVSVLGTYDSEHILSDAGKKAEVFVATDEPALHASLVDMLKKRKVMPVNALHRSAVISEKASLGHGNFIDAGATINTGSRLGHHNLIFSNTTIDHEAHIADFVQVGSGTNVGAGASIEAGAFVGAGCTIVAGVTIGENARVGAGSVVVADVAKGETVFGNPAKAVS